MCISGRVVTEFEAARGKQEASKRQARAVRRVAPLPDAPETDTPTRKSPNDSEWNPTPSPACSSGGATNSAKPSVPSYQVAATVPSENPREIEAEIVYLKELFSSNGG